MAKEKFERIKSHCNIEAVNHGKTSITASVIKYSQMEGFGVEWRTSYV